MTILGKFAITFFILMALGWIVGNIDLKETRIFGGACITIGFLGEISCLVAWVWTR